MLAYPSSGPANNNEPECLEFICKVTATTTTQTFSSSVSFLFCFILLPLFVSFPSSLRRFMWPRLRPPAATPTPPFLPSFFFLLLLRFAFFFRSMFVSFPPIHFGCWEILFGILCNLGIGSGVIISGFSDGRRVVDSISELRDAPRCFLRCFMAICHMILGSETILEFSIVFGGTWWFVTLHRPVLLLSQMPRDSFGILWNSLSRLTWQSEAISDHVEYFHCRPWAIFDWLCLDRDASIFIGDSLRILWGFFGTWLTAWYVSWLLSFHHGDGSGFSHYKFQIEISTRLKRSKSIRQTNDNKRFDVYTQRLRKKASATYCHIPSEILLSRKFFPESYESLRSPLRIQTSVIEIM